MRDFQKFRRAAVRYWERRRILYNIALIPPAIVGFTAADIVNWAGDSHPIYYSYILLWFVVSAIAANICYSLAYGLEFLFGNDDPMSRWLRGGRTTAFVGGLLLAMLLALIGGCNIAQLHWNYGLNHR